MVAIIKIALTLLPRKRNYFLLIHVFKGK